MGRMLTRLSALFCSIIILATTGGVFATWIYVSAPLIPEGPEFEISMNDFFFEPDMPENETSLLQRLSDILNRKYTTPNVSDARTYLLNDTIKVEWEYGGAKYVGSMDEDYAEQINELFGDIIPLGVSFILKNQDLNWDGYNEIALYSTSDPLDSSNHDEDNRMIVGVYVSVFTPVVDENYSVIGYKLVCDSLYGFCYEIYYNPDQKHLSSFSTDDWRDNVVYWNYEQDCALPMPHDAIALDGVSLYRHHYPSYHSKKYIYEGSTWGYTNIWIDGKTVSNLLVGQIPWIG